MIYVLANDGEQPGVRVLEFEELREATAWIASQLVYVEGIGMRTSKLYRVIEGREIEPIVFG